LLTKVSNSSDSDTQSNRDPLQETLKTAFQQCREGTLALIQNLSEQHLRTQVHPDFSPIGWHLGHIAYTEELWLLGNYAGKSRVRPDYQVLWAADGLPKAEREHLPTRTALLEYVETIRSHVLDYLVDAPLEQQERLWRWVIQHESQHAETIAFLRHLQAWPHSIRSRLEPEYRDSLSAEMVEVPAGDFLQGCDAIDAIDNEQPAHWVTLPTYWIDRYPVTQHQFACFIQAGGYQNPTWWSAEGWAWKVNQGITQPLYWPNDLEARQTINAPVYGVSGYEAEAYCQFVGKRLPTEAEWEKAAAWHPVLKQSQRYPWGDAPFPLTGEYCNHDHLLGRVTPVDAYPQGQSAYGCYDLLGNVWEWTATAFFAYPMFVSYPYAGYSATYFDHQHWVLKGGSWATRPWALRNQFRNWYHPGVRQILAGFRCASSRSL
jgi:gamma-glutamyl hercynylcysteine S-oxide synthase